MAVTIRIHMRNGSVAEVSRPDTLAAYEYVRNNVSYSGGRVVAAYLQWPDLSCRCVHNENWADISNLAAKQTPP